MNNFIDQRMCIPHRMDDFWMDHVNRWTTHLFKRDGMRQVSSQGWCGWLDQPRLDNQEMAVELPKWWTTLVSMCYFPNFESILHLILVSCSLGTHRRVSDTIPWACTPYRSLKRSKPPRARFVDKAWRPQLSGPEFSLCKSSWNANCSSDRSRKGAVKETGFNSSIWIDCSSMNVNSIIWWDRFVCMFAKQMRFLFFVEDNAQWYANMLCLPNSLFWNHVSASSANTDKINKFTALKK